MGDYRPLLDAAGFEVVSYEQIPGWQTQVEAGFSRILAELEALEAELGSAAAAAIAAEASMTLELQPLRRSRPVIADLR